VRNRVPCLLSKISLKLGKKTTKKTKRPRRVRVPADRVACRKKSGLSHEVLGGGGGMGVLQK